jgi:transcriptional regulator with PAS, ATPase and Fis domain
MAPPVVQQFEFLGLRTIVASRRMLETLDLAERVARSNATVLIQGESGSGKEVIARALHHMSLRSHRPFVDISCGALPDHLMESELFGYERGAFSGADGSKPGLFELAHTGTLFLDEVGELEPRMQVKLLRVLDGMPYYRLGGTKKISVDVRVLAATNADLELAGSTGQFRRDLYHRLSQMTMRVPPLRERHEDIGALASHFATQQQPGLEIGADALLSLQRHLWPGNVRELRNVMTRASIMASSGVITSRDLDLPERWSVAPGPVAVPSPAARTGADLDDLERETILRVLDETEGHRQRAADRLGISRRTLSRKLKQYHGRQLSGKTA